MGPRTIRDSHIARLDRIFQSEGFSRLSPENYVKVSVLQQALAARDETEAFLNGPLDFLKPPNEVLLNIVNIYVIFGQLDWKQGLFLPSLQRIMRMKSH